jgi:hypothetical protein
MGMFLIIWDKIFGTFAAELPEEPVKYGLVTPKNNNGAIKIIFHEFMDIWKDFFEKYKTLPLSIRLKYVFAPPGWSHDGSTKTSHELQREMNLKK